MFDPDRDVDDARRRYYVRLLTIAGVAVLGCVALWPAVSQFDAGADHTTACLAIKDGWHADKAGPSAAQVASAEAVIPAPPTSAQRADPEFMKRWQAEWNTAQVSSALSAANARLDWLAGSGACVPESRHRLIESGIGLGALAIVGSGTAAFLRRRRRGGDDETPPGDTAEPVVTLA